MDLHGLFEDTNILGKTNTWFVELAWNFYISSLPFAQVTSIWSEPILF